MKICLDLLELITRNSSLKTAIMMLKISPYYFNIILKSYDWNNSYVLNYNDQSNDQFNDRFNDQSNDRFFDFFLKITNKNCLKMNINKSILDDKPSRILKYVDFKDIIEIINLNSCDVLNYIIKNRLFSVTQIIITLCRLSKISFVKNFIHMLTQDELMFTLKISLKNDSIIDMILQKITFVDMYLIQDSIKDISDSNLLKILNHNLLNIQKITDHYLIKRIIAMTDNSLIINTLFNNLSDQVKPSNNCWIELHIFLKKSHKLTVKNYFKAQISLFSFFFDIFYKVFTEGNFTLITALFIIYLTVHLIHFFQVSFIKTRIMVTGMFKKLR